MTAGTATPSPGDAPGEHPGAPGRFDALLVDFTGVLVTAPFEAMARIGEAEGIDPLVVLELLIGDYADDGDHPWHRLERGEITILDYAMEVHRAAEAAGVPLDLTRMRGLMGGLEVHEPMVAAVADARAAGLTTVLVTNNVREAGPQWRALLDVDALFDAVIDSSEVGVRKPNPAIYRLALEAAGCGPDRAVFLDDIGANVAAASALGITTIHVTDPATAAAELRSLLGLPPT